MEKTSFQDFIFEDFDKNLVPNLMDFVRIPNLSRAFDKDWDTNGLLLKAANFLKNWVSSQNLENTTIELIQEKGRTPTLLIQVEATNKQPEPSLLFYGHLDKQPHFTGWTKGGPTDPIIDNDRLYGRGSADDGYAVFAAVLTVKTL